MQLLKVCVLVVHITIIGILFAPICTEACDGYSCASPRECCDKGCCYSWDFWVLLAGCLAIVIGICALITLCLRRSVRPCCRDTNQDRRSEPDSSGSCYAPPHYSRCSSFYQAPPPYTEVASKPDLYPLVINYAVGGCDAKSPQASYLMVQYFRNNAVQPSGSLSTTSTADSLNSCYICNMTNEADMMIPPPYSCTGSLDEFNTRASNNRTSVATQVGETRLLRSVSTAVCNEFQFCRNRNGPLSAVMNSTEPTPINVAVQTSSYETPNTVITASRGVSHENVENTNNMTNQRHLSTVESNTTSVVHNITTLKSNESHFLKNVTSTTRKNIILSQNAISGLMENGAQSQLTKVKSNFCNNDHILLHYSDNSAEESEQESNLPIRSSFCSTNAIAKRNINNEQLETPTGRNALTDFGAQIEFDIQPNLQEIQSSYSIANSINGSDISSLANLGTPDSPPRATSPTLEIRELLDKIQQLPQHRSPESETSVVIIPSDNCRIPTTKPKRYLARGITKTLYMPLKMSKHANKNKTVLNSTKTTKRNKNWLSRSAPSTPCANFTPVFPGQRKSSSNASRRDSRTEDASPLLMKQYDISEDEQNCELL